MSGWRRCSTCRKVKPADDFDADAAACRACMTAPVPRKRSPVVSRKAAALRPAETPVDRGPRLGSIGSGDLEVRERRARRAASEALAELHPEQFAVLLRDARAAEGLRPASVDAPAPSPEEA